MKGRPKIVVNNAQISLVLHAVAEVEGWCAEHPSLVSDRIDGLKTNENGHLVGSLALRKAIRRLEKETQYERPVQAANR